MHRIFLAINLPEETKKELISLKEQLSGLPLRWTAPQNLHLTLVFLGNTSEKEIQKIQKITKEVGVRHKSFSFTLSSLLYGPNEKKPRMIWAKGEIPEELSILQKDLQEALEQKNEHSFSLHITLARLREWEFKKMEPEERPEIQKEISFKVPVSSFEIMESKLKKTGTEYSIIESIRLSP